MALRAEGSCSKKDERQLDSLCIACVPNTVESAGVRRYGPDIAYCLAKRMDV